MANKKLVLTIRDGDVSKSLTFDNADSNVTVAKINTFTDKYNAVYSADYALSKALIRETTDTQLYPAI